MMVVGPVGSGKTTLLKGILGELPCSSGLVEVSSKSIAYCGQSAWLLNGTVRENVCGFYTEKAPNDTWYDTVLRACCLDQDVLQLLKGDETVIGSKASSLSGGQRQRLVSHIFNSLNCYLMEVGVGPCCLRSSRYCLTR